MKKYWWLGLLVFIEVLLFTINYQPGTYFLGWDNLFPEMNFSANITRSLFSVWQEYRGLGLLDGMSYAANLPHYLFLWLASLVLPQNILRYFFFFLMHFLGGVGMYLFLTKELVKRPLTAFFGALFYMFNLATIQMFFAPYELFAVHFAFLPWLIWFVLSYLRTGSRKTLIIFSLFSLAAVPQAHVPTVFLVYLAAAGIILLFSLNFKRSLLILATIFAVNAFWLLPYGYGLLRGGAGTVVDAKINQMSRADIYANQKARGDLVNVLTLKGFLLDASELDQQANHTGYIMSSWRQHSDFLPIEIVTGLFLLLAISGVIAVLRRREKRLYPFLVISFGAFFFLASNTPVFDFLNNLLRDNVSLIGEGFRFSFTKFSIIFAFTYTVFIVYGIEEFIKKGIFKILLTFTLLAYTWPAFQGNFFFNALRVRIPTQYFQTVEYFKTQPIDTRIGLFPQPTYWSWRFYNFGYRGSGFLWYGISQPTMDLAFDPWSRENENYYWEISQAVYSKNRPLFESVLNKYRINWLLVDENIINPSSPKALYTDELTDLVRQSDTIRLNRQFGNIKIYRVMLRAPTKSFVGLAQNLPNVGPTYQWGDLDQGYFDLGDYTTNRSYTSYKSNTAYPYRTLFSGRGPRDLADLPHGNLINPSQYPKLSHRDGYLIKVAAKGLFWVENLNSRRADLETYSSTGYFVLPPMEPDGLGYVFHADNLESLEVYKIDYWGLVQKREDSISRFTPSRMTIYDNNFTVDHPNPAFYKINLATSHQPPATLILSQSYDSGWVAFGAGKHILINNWANGWELDGSERIVSLFYWPQLLEFAGLGLLIITILPILCLARRDLAKGLFVV